MKGAEDIRNKYYEALVRISVLDPGLWQTMQDIANEVLGKKPRWRGKKKTPGRDTHVKQHTEKASSV